MATMTHEIEHVGDCYMVAVTVSRDGKIIETMEGARDNKSDAQRLMSSYSKLLAAQYAI